MFVCVLGCSYASSYVPPDDSRVRPRWDGDAIVAVGPTRLPVCGLDDEQPDGWRVGVDLPPPEMPWPAPAPIGDDDERDQGDDDTPSRGDALAAAAVIVVAAAGLASLAVGLAFAPAGRSQHNAAMLDDINAFNDELRRPDRCHAGGGR